MAEATDGNVLPRDALRLQFLEWLSDWSETNWCAGWYSGIEEKAREAGGLWLVVAAACEGWPKGYRAEDGWEPLTVEELARLPRTQP